MGGNGVAESSHITASVNKAANGVSATLRHVRVASEMRRVTDIGGDGRAMPPQFFLMSAGGSAQLSAFGLERIVEAVFGESDAGRQPEIAGRLGARRPDDRIANRVAG